MDFPFTGFGKNDIIEDPKEIEKELKEPTDARLFAIANAFSLGWSVEKVWEMTKIDQWFLRKLQGLTRMEQAIRY